ncbi:Na+/H+ antiporter subunit E [Flavobacterium sp. CS20]|uniref:Na+/H+ antiporter subunit E n=1 Tax=Flavobacterium sp. CS20 TaxID=2775246 RepID=UPI001B3A006D|nr:Na+/H+ antiporter subunit E [Flavobacterium sp. CS20]QTY26094.1 Na+/H+ antiporter subunit E [Flavobacterium sp. CS20]
MRSQFLSNILLMLIWVFLTGTYNTYNFSFGFVIGFLIIWLIGSSVGETKYVKILPRIIAFFFYFVYELVLANLEVAYEVMTPHLYVTPGIIKIPLDVETNLEISFLANLITLTPGTLSLDVSDDRKVLYVHSMYVKDKDEFIHHIKNGFERRILLITR